MGKIGKIWVEALVYGTTGEGIAWILLNIHQEVVIKEDTLDNDRRVLSCEIKIENQTYKLNNIYCPDNNAERKQFILYIDRYLEIDGTTCNILNGDFNCALDKKKYIDFRVERMTNQERRSYRILF